jgi:recombination protein RecT
MEMAETQIMPWQSAIANSERKFTEISAEIGNNLSFKAESMFALQALSKNDYLMKVATGHLDSLRDSIINVASIGLTLNPAEQYAYLVPRDGLVCLDISYKGLCKLATDTGAIEWVRADIVYENDTFKYKGPAEMPEHEADVFGSRGSAAGVYCIAKTKSGDILCEVMTQKEIEQVRDTSQSWKKRKKGPWKDWPGEMAKKTIIKRSSKTWPRSTGFDRLDEAIHVVNQHEGIDFGETTEIEMISDDQINTIHSLINDNGVDKDRFLKFAGVNEIEHITASDYGRCLSGLQNMVPSDD